MRSLDLELQQSSHDATRRYLLKLKLRQFVPLVLFTFPMGTGVACSDCLLVNTVVIILSVILKLDT